MLHEAQSQSSKSPYKKVPNCIGLYRHEVTGNYHGVKKIRGKHRERSLKTTDRKIAERKLKEWFADLEKVDVEVEKTTIDQLTQKFIAITRGKSDSSQCIVNGVLRSFLEWWPHGLDFQVRNIRPSDLEEWLAMEERRLKHSSYNRVAGVLKQLFELAVRDRIIVASPFEQVTTKWKRPQEPVRRIPTVEQFQSIVDDIRSQKFSPRAEDTADFVEFLGLAGLGQAEASSLTWGDVDFERNRMSIRRHKTSRRFTVPIYSHLRPLMEKLRDKAGGNPDRNERVLKILDAKRALIGACERLEYPRFSQRNLRQCLIVRLWKAGVDKKLIAAWQGHQDQGQLILQVYSNGLSEDDAEYERLQLAKLAPAPNVIAQIGAGQASPAKSQDAEPELRSA